MYYAQINQDNVVFAITETSEPVSAPDMIEIESFDTSLIGCTYANGQFIPPAPPPEPPEPRHISVGAFFDRFGAAKWEILSSTDPLVQAMVRDASVRAFIDLDRPDLLQGLVMVQSKGFDIDPQAIVSAEIQPSERP